MNPTPPPNSIPIPTLRPCLDAARCSPHSAMPILELKELEVDRVRWEEWRAVRRTAKRRGSKGGAR